MGKSNSSAATNPFILTLKDVLHDAWEEQGSSSEEKNIADKLSSSHPAKASSVGRGLNALLSSQHAITRGDSGQPSLNQ